MGAETPAKYQSDRGEVIGSVIIEQIDSLQSRELVAPRADLVCQHSARALGNALEHNGLFLMPLWRAIGQSRVLLTAKRLPLTLLISGAIIGTLLALFLIPKEFQLKAEGTLQPVIRPEIFFAANGEVEQVLVDHGQAVEQGQLLVQLKNNELDQEQLRLQADLAAAEEQFRLIERRTEKGLPNEGNLFSQKVELREKINGYTKQLRVLDEKLARLRVVSPIQGRVTSWDVENTLRDRPVTVGQVAMEIADPSGPWELNVYMPDNRIGHLVRAQQERGGDELPVNFILKSHTNESFTGTLTDVQETAAIHDEHGHSYRIRVSVDKAELLKRLQLDELKQGTEVVAKVDCGRRSTAYCLFHELLEWLQIHLFSF
jgi:multidrug efflux pump subunit AcrA (membrane-fusion protein)